MQSKWEKWRGILLRQPVVLLFLATILVVAYLNPMKLGLAVWGVSKLALFAFTGDWVDQRIFRSAQPHELKGIEQGTAWKRKGLIVAAAIIAGALLP